MTRKAIFLVAFFTFSFFDGQTQDFVFKVLANDGFNQFKSVSAQSWLPVRRGVSFNNGDMIRIADEAYLGLIHNSGKTVELIKPGEFMIDEIESNIDSRKKGIGSKYTEFVFNTIESPEDVESSEVLVTRGANESINVYMPMVAEVINDHIIIPWEPVKDKNAVYMVSVKGIFDDVLFNANTQENYYNLDLNHPSLKKEKMYVITISLKGKERVSSKEFSIDRLGAEEDIEDKAELLRLKSSLNANSSADQILMAAFYEENGLIVDAIASYHTAMTLSPQVDDFRKMYESFNSRNNLGHK